MEFRVTGPNFYLTKRKMGSKVASFIRGRVIQFYVQVETEGRYSRELQGLTPAVKILNETLKSAVKVFLSHACIMTWPAGYRGSWNKNKRPLPLVVLNSKKLHFGRWNSYDVRFKQKSFRIHATALNYEVTEEGIVKQNDDPREGRWKGSLTLKIRITSIIPT